MALTDTNAFERVGDVHPRPGYSVEPACVAWETVVFRLRGRRDAIACIPRAALEQFFVDLDAGRLDEPIDRFLASPPSGRVLRAADQTAKPGLFDELASADAIAPDERRPGRPGQRGRGGGDSSGSRREKRSRRRRPRRVLIAGLAVVAIVVAGVIVATRSDDKSSTALDTGGGSPSTTLDPSQPVPIEGATDPPALADLPPGSILFHGTSGDEIGCIPCDGLFRIMSVNGPGVTTNGTYAPQDATLLSAPLTADGIVTRLGARLSSADGGNWTLNVGCTNTETPGSCGSPTDVAVNASAGKAGAAMACSVPLGATACVRWDPEGGRVVKAGDRFALVVGNPGAPATAGKFTMEWWFVFIPD